MYAILSARITKSGTFPEVLVSIKRTCPECGRKAVFNDAAAGKKVKCRQCGATYSLKIDTTAASDATSRKRKAVPNPDEEVDWEAISQLEREGETQSRPTSDQPLSKQRSKRVAASSTDEAKNGPDMSQRLILFVIAIVLGVTFPFWPGVREAAKKAQLKAKLKETPLTPDEVKKFLVVTPPPGWNIKWHDDIVGVKGGNRVRIDLDSPNDPTVKSAILLQRNSKTQEEMIDGVKKSLKLLSAASKELPNIQILGQNAYVAETQAEGRIVRFYEFIVPEAHLYFSITIGANVATFQQMVPAFENSLKQMELKLEQMPQL